jgi:hypothetical protein
MTNNQDMFDIFDIVRPESMLQEQKYDILLIKAMVPFGHYTVIYEGMGCSSYIRNRRGKLEAMFYHNDDGYNPQKIEKIKEFVKRYSMVETKLVHDWSMNYK